MAVTGNKARDHALIITTTVGTMVMAMSSVRRSDCLDSVRSTAGASADDIFSDWEPVIMAIRRMLRLWIEGSCKHSDVKKMT